MPPLAQTSSPCVAQQELNYDTMSRRYKFHNPVEEGLTFSDFDEDSQEEIREAIREDVYDIIH
ncbi:hypothetical protein FACS1894179_05630 [Bacteroidia bacterium]|nr:hypothetical protein FACS1894179_05630 [Bacteroidia bacterium]